ncbi:uncharacterized protein LOC103570674 [Microplitis demolitor]|uniref:uncharacterized protein LOC103570674 n=1 Tax=Microplitis demolitor TaxID=69319 RepID=UPI0004CCE084|nr:uncharacterized protein LOC103570674 [Microplitis demolitor]
MGPKFRTSIIRSMFLFSCLSLLFANVKSVPTPIKQVRSLVSVINDITTLFTGMDSLIKLIQNDDSNEVFQKKVTDQLDNIYKACLKIDDVKKQVQSVNYAVSTGATQVISEINLEIDMSYMLEIDGKLNIIGNLYENDFNDIYQGMKNFGNETIDNYVSAMLDNNDLKVLLIDILKATKLTEAEDPSAFARKNIFAIAVANSKNEKYHHRDCNSISAYDKLYNFYKYVIATVTQGYTMIIMAYQYRKLHSNDPNFNRNKQLIYFNLYKEAIIKITESVQHYLELNDNANFKSSISCDPQPWKGVNYIRIKNYVSVRTPTTPHYGFMHNEPDRRGIEYECKGFAEYGDWAIPELIATKYCSSPFTPTSESSAYSEFTDHATRVLERKCALGRYTPLEQRCYSDESSDPILSVRKLSLLLQTCNSKRNEVVTNTRFHVQEGIISIEIQCGVFINGQVDPRTLRWNTDDRRYTRENHPNYVVLSALLRSFNLDDIVLPDGQFVTGMKFEKLQDNRLSLVLQGTEMYDSNNRIISGQTSLRYPQYTGIQREKIDLFLLTTPLEIKNQTYEMSESGRHYIELTESRESYKYQSMAVVPFLDMQPVSLLHPAPLGGVGLFYKGQPGYAGFLAFKHISPKYVHFISGNYANNLDITSSSIY